MAATLNLDTASLEEIEAALAAKRQQIEATKKERSADALKFIEDTLKKKYGGLTLADLGYIPIPEPTKREFTEEFYKNPADKSNAPYTYRYKGFGGVAADTKAWLYKDNKRNQAYRVNEDGTAFSA